MAAVSVSSALHSSLQVSRTSLFSSSADCCPPSSGPNGSGAGAEKTAFGRRDAFLGHRVTFAGGHLGLVLRFPPNFVRQLSNKARRNCSNIGVAQIVAASWSNDLPPSESPVSAASLAASAVVCPEEEETDSIKRDSEILPSEDEVPIAAAATPAVSSLFGSDQSLTVHAGDHLTPSFYVPFSKYSFIVVKKMIYRQVKGCLIYVESGKSELFNFK